MKSNKTALVFLVALASGEMQALGAPAGPHISLRELEVQVWTADEQDLPRLEGEVVRHLQTDSSVAMPHYLLSHLLVRTFSRDPSDLYVLKQAADIAQQAIDLQPRADCGYVALANILDLMGQPDRALALLDEAERSGGLAPSWRFYFTRSRLMADEAKIDKILGLLETALAFTDSEPRMIVPYVVALLHSQSSGRDLVAKLERWNTRFPSPLFALTTAITLTELGEHTRAAGVYADLLKSDPDNKEAKVNYAVVLYRDLKQPAKAISLLEDVVLKHAGTMAIAARGMVHAHLGAALLASGNVPQAGAAFERAVLIDPANLGVIDFATRSYREAKAAEGLVLLLKTLNDEVPGTGVLHALLGETLSEKLNQHDAALRAYGDALVLDPERSDFHNGLGLAHYRKKSYPEALRSFVAASEVNPSDATARYNEACVLALMGRGDDALTTLSEAVTLDPRLAQTARDDSDFSSLKPLMKFQELVQQPQAPVADETLGH